MSRATRLMAGRILVLVPTIELGGAGLLAVSVVSLGIGLRRAR
jgi:hypothetical protein